MSTSELLHFMIIFCILFRRNACILKQWSKTFQNQFLAHIFIPESKAMHESCPSLPSQCRLVQRGIKELGSNSVRQWKKVTAGHSWVRRGYHDAARTGILPSTSSCGHWWKCGGESWGAGGSWAPPSWALGLAIPLSRRAPCHLWTALPGSRPQLHRKTAAEKVIAHTEPVLKDNFLTVAPSFIVFSASSPCRSSIFQRQVQDGRVSLGVTWDGSCWSSDLTCTSSKSFQMDLRGRLGSNSRGLSSRLWSPLSL